MDDDQHTLSEYSQRHSSDVPEQSEHWNRLLFTWAGKSFNLEIADSDR